MRSRVAMRLLSPLLDKPYFTARQAREQGVSSSTLNHYIKTGRIRRIRRGVYQAGDYYNPAAFRWQDLAEIASAMQGGGDLPDFSSCCV